MAEIPIPQQHQPELTRLQYYLEELQREGLRLQAEFTHVMQMGQRATTQVEVLLQQHLGIDTSSHTWTLATERGVVVVPDAPADEGSVPADPGLPDPQDSAAAEQAREDSAADAPIPLRRRSTKK